jgi:hypothetical protein
MALPFMDTVATQGFFLPLAQHFLNNWELEPHQESSRMSRRRSEDSLRSCSLAAGRHAH